MTRRYYIFIFIFLLALFALAGHYLPNFQALSLKSKDNTTTSDFFIENMNSTVMLENGQPHYTLKAARLTHYPDQDIVELDNVAFQLFNAAPANWSAQAQQGRIENQDGTIHLKGDVILQRPANQSASAITLSTSTLSIHSEEDYAETSAPVKINHGHNQISATGMRLYLKDGRMEFTSATRVTYHVPR